MITSLLSDQRTGMVKDGVAELHEAPDATSKVSWRAEPGVIGRISHCKDGWCRIDAGGRSGFVEEAKLWGVDQDETIE
jgi:SH3-like domain-containing protein